MNLPANAGYLGLIPDLGEDPTCLRATKPMSHNYGAVLQSLGATTTKAPVSPGKTKHAYSRYLNVRFGDNIVQVWPTCLHFSERKTHREDLSQVPQWEGLTEGPKVASSASLGL